MTTENWQTIAQENILQSSKEELMQNILVQGSWIENIGENTELWNNMELLSDNEIISKILNYHKKIQNVKFWLDFHISNFEERKNINLKNLERFE